MRPEIHTNHEENFLKDPFEGDPTPRELSALKEELYSYESSEQKTLYFNSGGYRQVYPKGKLEQEEAQKLVANAIKEKQFAKLTGMVNGLRISGSVRVGYRHQVAAREMLFLLNRFPSAFDQDTLDWVNDTGNLEQLKLLAKGKWDDINTPGTKVFKKARSSKGVIQLTLAWRRLRSVLPQEMIREIRTKTLTEERISSLRMSLEARLTTGKQKDQDRKVMVQTFAPKNPPLKDPAKETVTRAEEDSLIKDEIPKDADLEKQKPKDVPPKNKKKEISLPTTETNEVKGIEEGQEEDRLKEKESAQTMAENAWEIHKSLLDYLVTEYPGLSYKIRDGEDFTKEITFIYQPKELEGPSGSPLKIEETATIKLPQSEEESTQFSMPGIEEPENIGSLIQGFIEQVKTEIKPLAVKELEQLLKKYATKASRKEKRALNKGEFDESMEEIRAFYTKGSLKLEVLLGLETKIETVYFSGGLLGSPPIKIRVIQHNQETGLEISGGKTDHPVFYSLESNLKDEIENK